MKTINLFLLLILSTLFYGCDTSFLENLFGKNEELSFVRNDYNGNELRTDGYYYHKDVGIENTRLYILFLYKNGYLLYGNYPKLDELEARENEYKNGQYYKNVKKYQNYWGLFSIDSTTIQYELLYYGPFRAYVDSGKIINDSTFVILKRKSSYNNDEKVLQDTFHLKQLSPKPDSINVFIK